MGTGSVKGQRGSKQANFTSKQANHLSSHSLVIQTIAKATVLLVETTIPAVEYLAGEGTKAVEGVQSARVTSRHADACLGHIEGTGTGTYI